jgi:precorrin-6B methylase 2
MLETYLADLRLPESARVLEVGTGTGAVARWPSVADVVGVDPTPGFVSRANSLRQILKT